MGATQAPSGLGSTEAAGLGAPRVLTVQDSAAFRRLREEMLADTPSAFTSSLEDEAGLSDAEWAARMAPDDDTIVLGVFDGDKLVGSAGLFRQRPLKMRHKATLWGVYVSPSARGRGVSRLLVQAILQHAATLPGILQVCLSVSGNNLPAQAVYSGLGFTEFAHEPRAMWVDGSWIDEKQMVKFLS